MANTSDLADRKAFRTPLVYAAAVLFYAVFIFRTSFNALGTRFFVLFEDAMISMRYARNLAEGNGLNWNAGEAPIEGYTNLLWTLWMALFHKLGLSESKVSLAIMLTGVVVLVGNAWVISRIARKVSTARFVPFLAATATLFCYPLVFWTLRGMEVGALALIFHTLLWLALELEDEFSFGKAVTMGLLGGASVLLRTDSALCVGLLGCYAALTVRKDKRIITLAIVGALAATFMGAHVAFRMHYYHEKVPNTAFLKLEHIKLTARIKRGVFVTLQVLCFHLAIPLASILGALKAGMLSLRIKEQAERRVALLFAFLMLQFSYAIYVGGDAWEWMLYANRYMSAAMPAFLLLVCVLFARVVEATSQEKKRAVTGFAIALMLCGLTLLALNGFAKVAPEVGIARTIVFSKKTFAAGALYIVLGGVLLALRASWEGVLTTLRAKLEAGSSLAALAVCAVLFLPSHLEPLGFWAIKNAAQFQDEANYARLGLLIRASTPDDFRIAVVAAGATPYYSRRPTEDILGKNDKHVAKQPPRGVFSPGHDKWDYEHSLGARNPALIVELSDVTPDDELYITKLGFQKLPNGLQLRAGAKVKSLTALGMPYDTDANLATALEAAERTP
jgi:hypothetical protein